MSLPQPTVMVVFGTRPEAVKVAPLISALTRRRGFRVITVVTAQHREMLDQVNTFFGITPDVDLDIMVEGQTLNRLTSRVIDEIDTVLDAEQPDAVVVQGDTTTVAATGIAAFNRGVPVIHLEAGLRSGDIRSPFPEEANRKIVSQVASLHLAPTDGAASNLLAEGVDRDAIVVTGNTVIDALRTAAQRREPFTDQRMQILAESSRRILLLTVHRRENLGAGMASIGEAVRRIADAFDDVSVVWPAHRNPRVRDVVAPAFDGAENILILDPMEYGEFAHALDRSHLVLTDSGGIQEEAPTLGKPVLVLRDNTERPEAVASGTARLVGTEASRIVAEASRLLTDENAYQAMSHAANPFGDGHAAEYAARAIEEYLTRR